MKTKATTLTERFGFKDRELTTPKHDDILCWLFNKSNIQKMLLDLKLTRFEKKLELITARYADVNSEECDWSEYTYNCTGNCFDGTIALKESLSFWATKNYEYAKTKLPNIRDSIQIEGEYAILSGSYNIGFVDAAISIENYAEISGQKMDRCTFVTKIIKPARRYFVEIKPSVQSLGELLRQINLYRSHTENGVWIILTDSIKPDFTKILLSQGIFVYVRSQEAVSA